MPYLAEVMHWCFLIFCSPGINNKLKKTVQPEGNHITTSSSEVQCIETDFLHYSFPLERNSDLVAQRVYDIQAFSKICNSGSKLDLEG